MVGPQFSFSRCEPTQGAGAHVAVRVRPLTTGRRQSRTCCVRAVARELGARNGPSPGLKPIGPLEDRRAEVGGRDRSRSRRFTSSKRCSPTSARISWRCREGKPPGIAQAGGESRAVHPVALRTGFRAGSCTDARPRVAGRCAAACRSGVRDPGCAPGLALAQRDPEMTVGAEGQVATEVLEALLAQRQDNGTVPARARVIRETA